MFRKKKKNYLAQMYKINPKTGNYIIEIALDAYRDVFNDWDSAQFKSRDIDPDLKFFLEGCSSDIPIKQKIQLLFYLPQEKKSKEKEKLFVQALKNNFLFNIHLINKTLWAYKKQAVFYILISCILLLSAFLLKPSALPGRMFVTLVLEGLFIGGWVFLWEAISVLSFKSFESRAKKKEYKRFVDADIDFHYLGDS